MPRESTKTSPKKHGPTAEKNKKPGTGGNAEKRAFSPQPNLAIGHDAVDQLGDDGDAFDNFDHVPIVVKVKPKDQLNLSQEELEKEQPPKVLYPQNPRAASNITQFSYKDRQYRKDDQIDQTVFHLAVDGSIWLKDSPEALDQEELRKRKEEEEQKRQEAEAVEVTIEEETTRGQESQYTLRNQFNFSDRGSQTFDNPRRDRGISTEPPPTTDFCESVTQWAIYDAYIAELEAQHQRDAQTKTSRDFEDDSKDTKKKADPLYSDHMKWSIKLMERIVNQNAENEIYNDFKFFEDKSDEFREGKGTLLPLWRFSSEKSKRKQVTMIKWNPTYSDLFSVGFGSYDFLRQGSGLICCYSLKNTRHPEYIFNTTSGVCCLDWHPFHPALLAVGTYDGTVQVFDLHSKQKKPTYSSNVKSHKHTDPVWEVRWTNEESSGVLSFYSVSSDGRICCWSLLKNKLEPEEVMELKLLVNPSAPEQDDEAALTGLAGGTCFDFNIYHEHLFLVGTEEGKIHECSKAYSGQYLKTYEGHTMAVYTVRWNTYHPNIFISASADWTVKIWDHAQCNPIMAFDLSQPVNDVAWAPYSSTVFAATTSDKIVHVYDLHVNHHEPICEQKVVQKAKLTHLYFNTAHPVILVGDDKGGVNCLKVSPNLRKMTVLDEQSPEKTEKDLQMAKMNHVLRIASEAFD